MERVLKRVGLSKKTQSDKTQNSDRDESTKVRRRRRSKSRRRVNSETKKTRGLFNIDWDSVKECKSCKSRAITRRFCSKRCDNELYRSNSFKFERFVRGNDEVSTLGKQISLCDDYSLPVDHLHKKRPNSIAVPSLSEWHVSSPEEEKIEILETYSTPRDSRQQLSQEDAELEPKCFTSPDREYSQPYTTEGSSEPSSDEEFFGHIISVTQPLELNSPDSIAEAILPPVNVQSPERSDIKRHPSPYYYADLYKNENEEHTAKAPLKYKKALSLDKSDGELQKTTNKGTDRSLNNQDFIKTGYHKKYRKNSENASLEKQQRSKSIGNHYKKSSSTDSRDAGELVMPPNRITSPRVCITPENDLDDEMTRQRHVYETAFDCRVSKSDDDLDQIDKVSNHPILIQLNTNKKYTSPSIETIQSRRKVTLLCPKANVDETNSIGILSQNLEELRIPESEICSTSGGLSIPLRGYTPSPPSTAPLPAKFHGKELGMNSIRSAPNLPSHPKTRLKDLHLPVKSLRGRSPTSSSGSLQTQGSAFEIEFGNSNELISEFKGRPGHSKDNKIDAVLEIKDRPRKELLSFKSKDSVKNNILEYKGRRRRHKYSSTESITTSSSGGSMESIKSSTSEGNRSTTSSESRHSSSLSSHSSDSGNTGFAITQTTAFMTHTNKLHILSPISDKSSQEPISETSDNNRNNNSQKCSPEEVATPENMKIKRRLPQNKNLLNLGFHKENHEIQGSDSGISIQSREGIKSRFGFGNDLSAPSQTDFSDLPFDMPKLRRRRMLEDACTSGSATSVDLRDLPFDMPKLRRRLRIQPNLEANASQASSSQSVVELEKNSTGFRPKLTLNLGEVGNRQKPGLGLSLIGLGLNVHSAESDIIDINLPLEKQGWFHGAITRVEAENVLKLLREGSFLVRNSESTKQDYSLSLKSTRGFMHMRIQRDGMDGSFILGQFSKPFNSIPEMIHHFSLNRLPIRGAEHMCLLQPVIAPLL